MSEVIVNVKWYIVAPARNRDVYLCIRRQMGRNSYKHTQHKLHANGFLNYIHTPDLFEKMNSTSALTTSWHTDSQEGKTPSPGRTPPL